MKRLWLIGWLLFCVVGASSQEVVDSLQTFYRAGRSHIDTLYMRNGESMSSFFHRNLPRFAHPDFELKRVLVVGSSSPEGFLPSNEALALRRAQSLSAYVKEQLPLQEYPVEVTVMGIDWQKLIGLVTEATDMPNQQEVLAVLQKDCQHTERLRLLKRVNRGIPYAWMYKHLFPQLRLSQVIVAYSVKESSVPQEPEVAEETPVEAVQTDTVTEASVPVAIMEPAPDKKPVYWALKTNALYDLLLIPNIGIEYAVNEQWSVAANWMYAWWSNRGKDNFWRIYGGDMEVRCWFGRKADEKPLQGHHVGVYGQLFTYDFELGGRGYLGDKWSYAFGLSYGYSLPLAKRLNLDFNLGLGYWGGKYKEYLPIEGHYVWQSTKQRHWWGPTKAEVSLVWLLGKSNCNPQKGGRP